MSDNRVWVLPIVLAIVGLAFAFLAHSDNQLAARKYVIDACISDPKCKSVNWGDSRE